MRNAWVCLLVASLVCACSSRARTRGGDAGVADGGAPEDSGLADASPDDSGPRDAAPDAPPVDAGAPEVRSLLIFVANNGQPDRVYRGLVGEDPELLWSSAETDTSADVAAGDFDGDGDVDFVVGNWVGAPVRVYLNEGDSFTLAWSSVEMDYVASLALADFDDDGDLDIAAGADNRPARIYRNDGSGTFEPWWDSASNAYNGQSVAWADYNDDGFPDLFVASRGNGHRLFANAGGTSFAPVPTLPSVSNDTNDVTWGDHDGDGDVDIFLADGDTARSTPDEVLVHASTGVFTRGPRTTDDYSLSVVSADFDGDGADEFAIASRTAASTVVDYDGSGLATSWSSGNPASDVTTVDYDDDGDADVLFSNTSGRLDIYENEGGVFTPAWTTQMAGDTTQGVAAALETSR